MDYADSEPYENDSKLDVKETIINMPEVVLIEEPLEQLINKRKRNNSPQKKRRRRKRIHKYGIKRTASPDYNTEVLSKDQTLPRYKASEYQCLGCKQKFSYFDAIQRHIKIRQCLDFSLKKNRRTCDFCVKIFCKQNSHNYETHLSLQHPEYKPQKCTECSQTFLKHFELKAHLAMHLYTNDNQCLACCKYFRTLSTSFCS
jgi:hypothetical protein